MGDENDDSRSNYFSMTGVDTLGTCCLMLTVIKDFLVRVRATTVENRDGKLYFWHCACNSIFSLL